MVRGMAPILSALLAALRRSPPVDHCLVCRRAVNAGDARMRLPGGGYVHRGCATYRMRQRERIGRMLA